MSQPVDPNEGQYRAGMPKPPARENLAAGPPPDRGDVAAHDPAGDGAVARGLSERERADWADEPKGPRLGSLAQAARAKRLNQARWLLIFIGILNVAAGTYFAASARSRMDAEIQNEQRKAGGMLIFNQDEIDKIVRINIILNIVACMIGVLFIVFGIIVKAYPVPITITGLVIYVMAALIFAVIEPESIARGLIIKIFIVVALASSIKAAIAYEKERALDPAGG